MWRSEFLLAYQEEEYGVVARFLSDDKGKSFIKGDELLHRKNATWAVSSRIRNAHPDGQIIVAEKQAGQFERKVYLLGEIGPIMRSQVQRKQD